MDRSAHHVVEALTAQHAAEGLGVGFGHSDLHDAWRVGRLHGDPRSGAGGDHHDAGRLLPVAEAYGTDRLVTDGIGA